MTYNLPDGVTSDDVDRDVDPDCRHLDLDLALGFAGDPAREYPDRGTCVECGEWVERDPLDELENEDNWRDEGR